MAIVFQAGWDNDNEGGASSQSIIDMTNRVAQKILDEDNPNQDVLQFADDVVDRNRQVTVQKGLHQEEVYRGSTWLHYRVRDNPGQVTFHLYVRTDPDDITNYEENVYVVSLNDRITRDIAWADV